MNTYRYTFAADCPSNGDQIIYRLEIQSVGTIMVEDIKEACNLHSEGYQEEIAAALHLRFGGQVRITAMHHGVEIETFLAAQASIEVAA